MKNKLCMLLLASGIGLFSCAEQNLPKEYTDSVNVFIGTGGHGHTFPGATLPHGMVQLSPDTRLLFCNFEPIRHIPRTIITTILLSWALPIPILVERVLEIMAIYSLCL